MNWPEIFTPIISALGTALAGLIVALIAQWLKRLNIQLDAERQALLESVVRKGVKYAEEQGRNYLTARGQKMAGPDKQRVAMTFVRDQLPKADPATAERMIGAVLQDMRASFPVAPHRRDEP